MDALCYFSQSFQDVIVDEGMAEASLSRHISAYYSHLSEENKIQLLIALRDFVSSNENEQEALDKWTACDPAIYVEPITEFIEFSITTIEKSRAKINKNDC